MHKFTLSLASGDGFAFVLIATFALTCEVKQSQGITTEWGTAAEVVKFPSLVKF